MSLPGISVNITDNAGSIGSNGTTSTFAYVGIASGGTANTVYTFSTMKSLIDTLVGGPLVECAALALQRLSAPIIVVPLSCDVSSTTTPVLVPNAYLSISGTPTDEFQVVVKMVLGGAVGVATFQYSLDNGASFSTELISVSSYVIPASGITLNFGVGTYVAGDKYTFTSTMPGFTTTSLNTGLNVLGASNIHFNVVHVVGVIGSTTDTLACTAGVAMSAALHSKLQTWEGSLKYVAGIIDGCEIANTSTADGLLSTAVASAVHPRVSFAQGFETVISPVSGRSYRRPFAWDYSSLVRSLPYWQSPHCPVRGALSATSLERDEYVRPGLDAARITTARTVPGQPGFYITRPLTLALPTSDFKYFYNRLTMDRACSYTVSAVGKYLNEQFAVNADGTIQATTRAIIESNIAQTVGSLLETEGAIVKGSFVVVVDPTVNLTTTETLKITIRFRVKGTASQISTDIGCAAISTK